MTEQKFKVGDVVRLRSGAVRMTVCCMTADSQRIVCDWHDNSGGGCQGYYRAEQLEIVEPYKLKDKWIDPPMLTKGEIEHLKTVWDRYGSKGFAVPEPDTFNREMPPAPPSSQEDLGPTKADGTLRNVATVQMEENDK